MKQSQIPSNSNNFTILCVDDDLLIRSLISTILKKPDYTVLTADSGATATKLLESAIPNARYK